MASGEGHANAAQPVMAFVSSGEGLQLSLAFMKIKDPKVRKRVLDLVKSLNEEETAGCGLRDAFIAQPVQAFPRAFKAA